MKVIYVSVLLVGIFIISVSSQRLPTCSEACGALETYTPCQGSLSCQESCNNTHVMPFMKCACIKGCRCKTGYVRDPYTMNCIPRSQCALVPLCGKNEEWSDTMADCQNTCSYPDRQFLTCQKPGCVCAQGFIRRSSRDQECIPISECTGCQKNFAMNVNGVCELNCNECSDPNAVYNDFTRRCECVTGMLMNPQTKKCGCPANEMYSCGNPFCESTCNTKMKLCAMSMAYCVQKCYCAPGFMRITANGHCVKENACPSIIRPVPLPVPLPVVTLPTIPQTTGTTSTSTSQ